MAGIEVNKNDLKNTINTTIKTYEQLQKDRNSLIEDINDLKEDVIKRAKQYGDNIDLNAVWKEYCEVEKIIQSNGVFTLEDTSQSSSSTTTSTSSLTSASSSTSTSKTIIEFVGYGTTTDDAMKMAAMKVDMYKADNPDHKVNIKTLSQENSDQETYTFMVTYICEVEIPETSKNNSTDDIKTEAPKAEAKIEENVNEEFKYDEVTSPGVKFLQFYEYNISDKLTPSQLKALNSCEIDITGNFLKGNSITSWFDAIQQEGLNTAKLFTKDGNQIYLKDIVKLDELYTFTGIKNFKEIKNMLKAMSNTDQLINITNEALNTANLGGVNKLIEGNTEEGITAINNTLTEVKKIVFSSVTEFVFHNIQHMMATFEDLCKQLINEMPTKITGYTLEKYTKELNTINLNKIIDDLKKNTKEALEQSIQTELNNLGATKIGSLVGSFNTTMENINSFALSGISKINSIIDQIPEGTKWVDTQVNKNMENVYAAIGEKLFNSYEYLRNQRDLLAKQVGDRIGEYKARKANEKIEKNAIKTLQQAQKIKTMASSFAESQKHVLKMWLNRIIKL